MNKISKGKLPVAEAIGSIDEFLNVVRITFSEMCKMEDGSYNYDSWIVETFDTYAIVYDQELPSGVYYKANFTYDAAAKTATFENETTWETVELDYVPSSVKTTKTDESTIKSAVHLVEGSQKSPKIKVHALTANKKTINGTYYPLQVLEAAAKELTTSKKLNESTGQGKIRQLLGEVEHPRDKKTLPSLNAAAFKWESVYVQESALIFEGKILPTESGELIKSLINEGVEFGFSIRGTGEVIESENVTIVTELRLTGLDAVLDPSDTDARLLEIKESKNKKGTQTKNMNKLLELIRDFPEFFSDITLQEAASYSEEDANKRINSLRAVLQINESADIVAALTDARQEKIDANLRKDSAAIAESVKNAITVAKKFGPNQKAFADVLNGKQFTNLVEANAFIEAQKEIFTKISASGRVGGETVINRIQVTPVTEAELGIPEFAKAAFDIAESIRQRNESQDNREFSKAFKLNDPNLNRNKKFAADYLKKFDQKFSRQLMQESAMFSEANATSDLQLPYSVNRALIDLAVPTLVASSIFDVAVAETSPMVLYFNKAMTAETGLIASISAETFAVPGSNPTAIQLAHKRIKPGTVVITGKVEDTDFFVDYANGQLYVISGYTTPTSIAYDYYAIREGELAEIQRMKQSLDTLTITAQYDRLATQIPYETIAFSRSQMGMDFVGLALSNLAFELAKILDSGMMKRALLAAKVQGSTNISGTYSLATNTPATLAKYITEAAVKVQKRYYQSNFCLMGLSNAAHLSTWDALTAAGARSGVNSDLNGFISEINGLPIFRSTEMEDGASSRILVGDRQTVQYRVFDPMTLVDAGFSHGSGANAKVIDSREFFLREGNATECVIKEKVSNVKVSA